MCMNLAKMVKRAASYGRPRQVTRPPPASPHENSIPTVMISTQTCGNILFHRYPTLETTSQNSRPPSLDHPNGPKSHSAQANSFICGAPAGDDDDGTGRENAIFSKAMGDGVTSHQSICAGGVGRGCRGAGGGCEGGSSSTLSLVSNLAAPALRMTLPHPGRGHKMSNVFSPDGETRA